MQYVDAGELEPLGAVDWLINGAGAFEIGGPEGDNGLSGKKLVAQAYGTAVPIGGGATWGKDPRKVDPRGQRMAREMALDLVRSGSAHEATVWLAWRPGDVEPRWVEVVTVPVDRPPAALGPQTSTSLQLELVRRVLLVHPLSSRFGTRTTAIYHLSRVSRRLYPLLTLRWR